MSWIFVGNLVSVLLWAASTPTMVWLARRVPPILASDIPWVEANGSYSRINFPENRTYTMRRTITALESLIDPSRIARIHRSAIVNLTQFSSFNRGLAVATRSFSRTERVSKPAADNRLGLIAGCSVNASRHELLGR